MLSDSFYYGGVSVVDAFLSILLTVQVTHGRLDMVGFVLGYALVVRALAELPFAYMMRHLSFDTKRRIIFFAFLVYGLTLIAMGFSTSVWHVFLAQTITALMNALAYPIKWPTFASVLDRGKEALEWSAEDVLSNALPAVSSIVAGLLAERYGVTAAFLFLGILMIVSGTAFIFIRPRHPRSNRRKHKRP